MTSDDVKPKQLVVIVRHRCNEEKCEATFTGRPFKVKVVSLPFAVLEDCIDGQRCPIDLREWELAKVSRQYVNSLLLDDVEEEIRRCPHCNEILVQKNTLSCGVAWWCERCEKVMGIERSINT